MRVPLPRVLEYVRSHRTQFRADRQAKIRGGERVVGNFARIAPAHADGQRMRVGDAAFAGHRGHDGNVQRLGERGQFLPRFGENHAAAGNQHGFFGAREQSDGALHVLRDGRDSQCRSAKKRGLGINVLREW